MNQNKINPFLLGGLIVVIGIGVAYISANQKKPPMGNFQPMPSQAAGQNTGTPGKNTTTPKTTTSTKTSTSVNGYYQLN